MEVYTGRQIGIFADCHGLVEPLKAVLEDMKSRGISEIYSLGDNIGLGPNPKEVMNLIGKYQVISLAGNSEDYCTLGIEPFTYFTETKKQSYLWTLSKLSKKNLSKMESFPHSIDLLVGGKKIALCHFANDVRFDYIKRSTWTYQTKLPFKKSYKQFLYTNSKKQLDEIHKILQTFDINNPKMKGYLSAIQEPLFQGKSVEEYDAIIQGHVHYKIYEKGGNTEYYSIRAVGMAYQENPVDTASYIIVKERKDEIGFEIEEVLVKYDREHMKKSIINSDGPMDIIKKFTEIND